MKLSQQLGLLTIQQKARLLCGVGFWNTYSAEHTEIKSLKMADGPHGLRLKTDGKENNLNDSVPATCFPTASALACSFDPSLAKVIGQAIATEAAAHNIDILLAPSVNIKRSVLCGRNFEYYSEDPYLSGQMGAEFIKGVQSCGVGACVKHFAVNGQEKNRMGLNTVVDDRALREIYLSAFETIVKEADPYSIMGAYNKVNNHYCCSNFYLLTNILREEWGFEGLVMSDWGAVVNIISSVKAGLDLQMPDSLGESTEEIVAAVVEGRLTVEELDRAVANVIRLVRRCIKYKKTLDAPNFEANYALARKAAAESGVLLENKGALPLKETDKLVVVGDMAQNPRYQGGGSSHVNNTKLSSLLDELKERKIDFTYFKGYKSDKSNKNPSLSRSAVGACAKAEKVVLVAGLPSRCESEGFDRKNLLLPKNQIELIKAITKVNQNVTLVLLCGSAVEIPAADKLNAILQMHLAGQAVSEAVCDLLFGDVNPCGKLAQTWPLRIEDTPDWKNFGDSRQIVLKESIFVGYRYYQFYDQKVAYPFGHGLSYTKFKYSALIMESIHIDCDDQLKFSFKLTNSGKIAGSEIVQIYVKMPSQSKVLHPVRQLRAFAKVALKPNKSEVLSFVLNKRDFAYYDPQLFDWVVENGIYTIEIGSSCEDIRLSAQVEIDGIQVMRDDKLMLKEYYLPLSNGFNISDRQFAELFLDKIPNKPLQPKRGSLSMENTLDQLCKVSFRARVVRFFAKTAIKFMNRKRKDAAAVVKLQIAGLRETPIKCLPSVTSGVVSRKFVAKLLVNANTVRSKRKGKKAAIDTEISEFDMQGLDITNLSGEYTEEEWQNVFVAGKTAVDINEENNSAAVENTADNTAAVEMQQENNTSTVCVNDENNSTAIETQHEENNSAVIDNIAIVDAKAEANTQNTDKQQEEVTVEVQQNDNAAVYLPKEEKPKSVKNKKQKDKTTKA